MQSRHSWNGRRREVWRWDKMEWLFYLRQSEIEKNKADDGEENSNRNLFHSSQREWKAFARDNIPFVRNVGRCEKKEPKEMPEEMFSIQFNSNMCPTTSMQYFNLVSFRIFSLTHSFIHSLCFAHSFALSLSVCTLCFTFFLYLFFRFFLVLETNVPVNLLKK